MTDDDIDFGTDPHKLARREDPDTSHEAAGKIDSAAWELEVCNAVASFGSKGCIQDDVLSMFPPAKYNTVTPRFKALISKGFIEDTGERRRGKSGRNQRVVRVCMAKTDILSKNCEQKGLFE
jgi:hypothetical protein